MIIKSDYVLRHVMDYYLILGIGKDAYVPNEIMSLNETGAFLWEQLKTGAEPADLTASLVREYEVDEETAEKDVETFLGRLREKGMIDE